MTPLGEMYRHRARTRRLARVRPLWDWWAVGLMTTGLALFVAVVVILGARL